MTDIRPQPGILDIALYQGGKAHVAGVQNAVKAMHSGSEKARDSVERAAGVDGALLLVAGLAGGAWLRLARREARAQLGEALKDA